MADLPPLLTHDADYDDSCIWTTWEMRAYAIEAQLIAVEQATKEKDAEIALFKQAMRLSDYKLKCETERAESAERELDLWKLKWKQLNDDLAEALDELDSLRNKTKPKR